MSPPEPPKLQRIQTSSPSDYKDMLACIGQLMLCLLGGGWAGYTTDPQSAATLLTGAMGVVVAWFTAYSAAHFVGMLFAPAMVARDALRWLRGTEVRNAGDERRFEALMVAIAVVALVAASVVVAVVVWAVADHASLLGTLARFIFVAGVASLLTSRAYRAVGEIRWGAPPP